MEDTGIGIAPEQLQAVMEPFAQVETDLDRRFEGLGLDLGCPAASPVSMVAIFVLGKASRAGHHGDPDPAGGRSIDGSHLTAIK